MSERGKYFVIEGHDGTGKSTQVELLGAYLREEKGIESFIAHEPGGTPIADAIRTVIKNGELERDADTNILLFTAARHEIWKRARRELELGKYVLSARNYWSTIAYQIWGEHTERPFGPSPDATTALTELTRQFTDDRYMQPNAAVILTLDNAARSGRISQRGALDTPDTFEMRGESFQQKVTMGYEYVVGLHSIPTIDASGSIEEVQIAIREIFGV